MITFGLTGGIASGKSTATKTFRKHNIPIVDADIVARQVVEPGTKGLSYIVDIFTSAYLDENGFLDRAKLGKLVFSDADALNTINRIMGPLINAESDRQLQELHQQGHQLVGYDAALICEMGNSKKYRPLIVVSCPQDEQVARLMSRNSLTRAEAMSRIEAQMPVAEKIKMADYVIDTSGPVEDSIKQTESIIQDMIYYWLS